MKKLLTLMAVICCTMWAVATTYTPVDASTVAETYITDIRLNHNGYVTFKDNYSPEVAFNRYYRVYVYVSTPYSSMIKLQESNGTYSYNYGTTSGLATLVANDAYTLENEKGGVKELHFGTSGASIFGKMQEGTTYHIVIHPQISVPGISLTSYYGLNDTQNGYGTYFVNSTDYLCKKTTADILLGGKDIYQSETCSQLFGEDFSYDYDKANKTLSLTGNQTGNSDIRLETFISDLTIRVNGTVALDRLSSTNPVNLTFIGSGIQDKLILPVLNVGLGSVEFVAINGELGSDEIPYSFNTKDVKLKHACVISEGLHFENGLVKDANGVQKPGYICIGATSTANFSVTFYSSNTTFDASTLIQSNNVKYGSKLSAVPMAPATSETFLGWAIQGIPSRLYSASDIQDMTIIDDITFMATYGSITPQFSVSSSKAINFAPGNLQYNTGTQKYSFASSQLEVLGNSNVNGSNLSSQIDLFGWGTANTPTNTSTTNSNYSTFVDWGTKSITNGGSEQWFTLTKDEWNYLLKSRPNASSLLSTVRINGQAGLLLLPDNYSPVSGITIVPGVGMNYMNAEYTTAQWAQLEAAGAVFLPIPGKRQGTELIFIYGGVIGGGEYWTSTSNDANTAYALSMMFAPKAEIATDNKSTGCAVRLAKTVVAQQAATTYSVKLDAETGGVVMGAQSGEYISGSTLSVTAIAAPNFQFKQWSDGNTNASRTITVNKNISLTALFEYNPTGIEDISIPSNTVVKLFINGQVYIQYGDKLYDIQGRLVK